MGTFVFNPMLSAMEVSPEKDFEPVALLATFPLLICVSPSFPANSIPELIAIAKAKPDTVNVAITSTAARVAYELFKKTTGTSLFMVPYNGQAPAIIDGRAGRVSVIIEPLNSMLPYITSGQLKALAISTKKTSPLMPGLKSVIEQGTQGFEIVSFSALFAPRGSPGEIANLVNAEVNKILARPETRQRLKGLGADLGYGTPPELAAYVTAERDKWGPIIKAAGIKDE